MTVSELIEELRKYPGDMQTSIFVGPEYYEISDVVRDEFDSDDDPLIVLYFGDCI